MIILYFFIALVATLAGSMTGAGGGVIMKPVIDLFNQFDVTVISILTSFTLIGMSIVNITGHIIKGTKVKIRFAVLIVIGGVLGGSMGGILLNHTIAGVQNNQLVQSIQNAILLLLMITSFIYVKNRNNIKSLNISNPFMVFIVSFMLGAISSFLGIGGGPINVAVIMFFFGIGAKETAVYSILLILFAQISKMTQFTITHDLTSYDLTVLPAMIIGGILGGYNGAKFNKKLDEKLIVLVFNIIQIFVIITCIINIVRSFF